MDENGEVRASESHAKSDRARAGDMVGLFSALGKASSSSSSSNSETSPLLNGSHEGPCYAYSYGSRDDDGEIVRSCSSTRSGYDDNHSPSSVAPKLNIILKNIKFLILSAIIIFCMVSLNFLKGPQRDWKKVTVIDVNMTSINAPSNIIYNKETLRLSVKGLFLPGRFYGVTQDFVRYSLEKISSDGNSQEISEPWLLLLSPTETSDLVELHHDFVIPEEPKYNRFTYQIRITTNKDDFVELYVAVSVEPIFAVEKIIMALFVIIGLHLLIIFELTHRTVAAMTAAITSVSFLAIVEKPYSMKSVSSWIDVETLSLIIGMMFLVSLLCETGFYDYTSALICKVTHGHFWSVLTCSCFLTVVLSAFFSNVVVALFMSAINVRLSEAINIDSSHMLMAMVIFCNIGGSLTPLGAFPNSAVVYSRYGVKAGLNFGNFTLHVLPAVVLSLLSAFILVRILYRDGTAFKFSEPPEVLEINKEIKLWQRTSASISNYCKEEDIVKSTLKRKVTVLQTLLRKKLYDSKISEEDFRSSFRDLSNTLITKNTSLLIKSGIIFGAVVIFFILYDIPQLDVNLGWITILGAICLLLIGDFEEVGGIFSRIEWSTLLFISSIFVVIEALTHLEFFRYIAKGIESVILNTDPSYHLPISIVLILWVSAFSSIIFSNIPITIAMVEIIGNISENPEINVPIKPLMYALALGSCMGGNGNLLSTSANIVTAGIAEEHGGRFTFYDFYRIGFPITLVTTALCSLYLLFCHVWLKWND